MNSMQENLHLYELLTYIKRAVYEYKECTLSPLQTACMLGQKHKLRRLIKRFEHNELDVDNAELSNALYLAVARGNPTIIGLLVHMKGYNQPVAIHKAREMTRVISNFECHEVLQNYLPPKYMILYTRPLLDQKRLIPVDKLDACQYFFMQCNLHPVFIVLNLQKQRLYGIRKELKTALELQTVVEMCKSHKRTELIALKSYYFSMILKDLILCAEAAHAQNEHDALQAYIRMVYERTYRGRDYIEHTVRSFARIFPYQEALLMQQIMIKLLEHKHCSQTLWVLRNTMNGGNLKKMDPQLQCSCCSSIGLKFTCDHCDLKYCSETCQTYHSFMHEKLCQKA